MVQASCLCGAIRIQSTGDVQAKAVCHCGDCRKITGSTYSTNMIVSGEGFSVLQGTPKQYGKTAKSGATITSFFCGDCGSTLWRSTPTYGDAKILKVGTFDDAATALEDAKPAVELLWNGRPSWVAAIEGAEQTVRS